MGFEKVIIEQALQEYEGKLTAMGLNEADKSLFVRLMRTQSEEWEKSIGALHSLIVESPTIAMGDYLDQLLIDHEWRGPMDSKTTVPTIQNRSRTTFAMLCWRINRRRNGRLAETEDTRRNS
ncbi:UNVERIFIED_ORG: hypothetical protein ABIC54_004521 [Burkholderia sp. 1263]